ncbi:MAG: hypothetical protein ACTHJL_05290 [Amnibacterium sp.]
MPIPFFGPAQMDAFIPALVWFLVATVLAVAPVVLAPLLARKRSGLAVTITAAVLAVVAAVPGVLAAVAGLTRLGDERALVQQTLADRYGVAVDAGVAGSLLEGGKVKPAGFTHTIHLQQTAPGTYAPVEGTVGPLQPR